MDKVSLSNRNAVNITATKTIPGGFKMAGFYVNSTAGGSFTITDGASVITGAITPAIGFHWFPYEFNTSATFTVTGTINFTALGTP